MGQLKKEVFEQMNVEYTAVMRRLVTNQKPC